MKIFFIIALFLSFLYSKDKIVTLNPALNEIVYALGLGQNVVANTHFSNYPESSKSVLKIGGYGNISLEKIIQLNPDFIISYLGDKKINDNLKNLNFKVYSYKTETLEDIKDTILSLGEIFSKQDVAKDLNKQIEDSLKLIENIITNQKILVVFTASQKLQNQIYVASNFVYFEDIIKRSSNINAYQSSIKSQPVLNIEKIIALNPDIIVLLAPYIEDENEKIAIIKSFETLKVNASENKNIYMINGEYASIPSHRVKYFIDDFREILEDVRAKKLQ